MFSFIIMRENENLKNDAMSAAPEHTSTLALTINPVNTTKTKVLECRHLAVQIVTESRRFPMITSSLCRNEAGSRILDLYRKTEL